LLAGCTERAETASPGAGTDRTETDSGDAYEACIEPAGCRTFEAVPETYLVYRYDGSGRTSARTRGLIIRPDHPRI
jgi:hypothetical protein